MTNFQINFEHPWLLLLLIPAIALPLLSYFKLSKRYRCTRNRIVSLTLHLIVMFLSIAVLAGLTFSYYKPNIENEVILLVDVSYSNTEDKQEDVDSFIKSVVDTSNSKFKLGIVTFGYDQVYAAPLTNQTRSVYSQYLQAPKPNVDTATDIASALTYTAELFTKPETARIVLLTDALETDKNANNVIKSVASKGIKVDTVYFSGENSTHEVQVLGATYSADRIIVGQEFMMEVTIQSSYTGNAKITPTDSGVDGKAVEVSLVEGINKVVMPCKFTLPGMHELSFKLTADGDESLLNNVYQTYFYIPVFDDILIIEGVDNESDHLTKMLSEELKVTIIPVNDTERMPKTTLPSTSGASI